MPVVLTAAFFFDSSLLRFSFQNLVEIRKLDPLGGGYLAQFETCPDRQIKAATWRGRSASSPRRSEAGG